MAAVGSPYNFPETSLRDFYNVLFRQKRKILLAFFSVMFAAVLITFLCPRVYNSETELLLRIGRENATLGPTATTGKIININTDRENEINSEVDILRSRELAEKLVDAIGAKLILHGARETLPADAPLPTALRYWARQALRYPFTVLSRLLFTESDSTAAGRLLQKDLAILSFMKRLDVQVSKKSNMITITYGTNDPELARSVLNRFVGFYLEKHIAVNRTPGSYTFFKKQKSALRSALDRTEEELKDLKNRTAVASISEQRRILMERIGAIKRQLENTKASAAAAQARVWALTAALARLPSTLQVNRTTGFANSAADAMRKQIYELEIKEQKLLSTFTEKSIPVQEIRREIRQCKALLLKARQQDQTTTGINENHQKLQLALLTERGNLASLRARILAVGSALQEAGRELNALNDTVMRFEQLELDLATQRSNYLKYSDSLEQARIDEALDMQRISNISIVEPATCSVKPVRPRTLLDLALGFFLAVSGAVGLACFCEFQDHSLKNPEDVTNRLHLPMVATLPLVSPHEAQGPLPTRIDRDLFLGGHENGTAIADLLRLCSGATPSGAKAIALAGCRLGEGVSTAAALFAGQLAQRGEGPVLLIDANSVNPGLHTCFGTSLSPGLTDLGSNGYTAPACIQAASVENLDLLSAGNGGRGLTPSVLKTFSEVLPALRRKYRVIICDLPPLLENSPAVGIASVMDGVVLVVEAEKTRREVAAKVKESLLQADVKVLGVILNKRRFHIPRWLYKTL
jgi:succinoglycan biosynthesis transport protein ExoP